MAGRGKVIPLRINSDIRAARSRGMDLASMHPAEVRPHKDPVLEDDLYPMTAGQAAAKARLLPATWRMGVRIGWAIFVRSEAARADERER